MAGVAVDVKSMEINCKAGTYHDFLILYENQAKKIEQCKICGKKFKWNKTFRGRISNQAYLAAHLRSFCQRFGRTKRAYYKIYNPSKLIIYL